MPTSTNFENPSWASTPEQQISPDVYIYRCISPWHAPWYQSPKRPGDVDVSPLAPSLLAGLLMAPPTVWLSLHTLVHGRLKPYLGSRAAYCPLRIHTPYMNPYETRSAWCAVPWRSPALLYSGFPQSGS